ncbi:asparaginase [Alicyclobacillus herbarius]|uniref:asparaginase n=1 Tax=Alicyclobacillus herbarius TaxID=122960 RepID=UPI0004035D4D|nr:asparaginase [Alicyclobacillus herbarius]
MSESLVEVWRGPLVESRHRGDVVVVDDTGQVVYACGNPDHITFARSTAKPLQVVPLLETGAAEAFALTDEEIALCSASHSGEPSHVGVVRGLLARAGIPETCLQCGVHPPYHTPTYEQVLRSGESLNPLYNNCSGKHAGMLVLAKHLGADFDTYLHPDHPVQRKVKEVVADLTEVEANQIAIGIDGCGVPVFGLPLKNLALAYAKLARPDKLSRTRAAALRRIRDAMMSYPHHVGGSERFCTELMAVAPGEIVAKVGAEGVYSVGLPKLGLGMAVKIEDGNARAAYPTVVEALSQMQALAPTVLSKLEAFWHPVLKNHRGIVVGRIVPDFRLETYSG